MIELLIKITRSALFGYFLVALFLYVFQRNILYYPSSKLEHRFEDIHISSQGETIEVIVLNKGKSKALIYFGGNAEAVAANAEDFSSQFTDVTTYLVNYRGYAGSSGKPTEEGNYSDALAIYDHIKRDHAYISVAGRSLGSGVATYLATHRPIESIVLITPYDSILSVAQSNYSLFPVRLLLKDVYDSVSRVQHIKVNTLVIAAENDQIIPMKHTQNLIEAFNDNQVSLKIIKNSGHNTISNNPVYFESLKKFL